MAYLFRNQAQKPQSWSESIAQMLPLIRANKKTNSQSIGQSCVIDSSKLKFERFRFNLFHHKGKLIYDMWIMIIGKQT